MNIDPDGCFSFATLSGNHEFSIGIGLAPVAIVASVVTIIVSGGQMINAVGELFRQIFSF